MARNKTSSSIDQVLSLLYGDQSKNFPPKVEEALRKSLIGKINEFSESELNELSAIAQSYSKSYRENGNVNKILEAAVKSKKDFEHPSKGVIEKPGDFDFADAAKIIASRFPVRQSSKDISAYPYKKEKYGMPFRAGVDNIKEYEGPVAFTKPVESSVLSVISRAHNESSKNLTLQTKRLINFLEHKKDIPEADKLEYEIKSSNYGDWMRDFAYEAAKVAYKPFDLLGRGIYSKTDPANISELKKFQKNRDALITHLLHKYAPNNGARAQIMTKLQHILNLAQNDENGMLDKVSFEALTKLIEDEIGQDNSHLKEVTKKMNALYAQVFDLAKEKGKESDDLWKYRALQIALLVTPFAGISLLSPLSPFLGALGSVFSNGIAGGAVEIMRSLGPFSYFVELLRLDVAIEWLFSDSPIVGDIFGVVDAVLTSEPVKNLTGNILMPVLFAPLVPMVVAGAYSLARIPTEYDFHEKYKKGFAAKEKALNNEIKALLDKEDVRNKDDKWVDGFVNKKINIFEQAFMHESFLNFVKYLDAHSSREKSRLFDVFGENLYKDLQNCGIFFDYGDGDYKVNYETLNAFLFDEKGDNKELHEKMMDKFHAFNAVVFDSPDKEIDEICNKFNENSLDKNYIQKGKKILDQNFLINMKDARGEKVPDDILYSTDLNIRDKYVNGYKQDVIKQEVEQFKKVLKESSYNSSNVEGVSVFGNKISGQKFPGKVVRQVTEVSALQQNPSKEGPSPMEVCV